jgi:hypothetical protein
MKTRFTRYSACLLLPLAVSAPALLHAQGTGPDFSRLPQIRVQSPLLSVPTQDAAQAEKEEAKPAAPVKPAVDAKPAADTKPPVKMKEPTGDLPASATAAGSGSPALLPATNGWRFEDVRTQAGFGVGDTVGLMVDCRAAPQLRLFVNGVERDALALTPGATVFPAWGVAGDRIKWPSWSDCELVVEENPAVPE